MFRTLKNIDTFYEEEFKRVHGVPRYKYYIRRMRRLLKKKIKKHEKLSSEEGRALLIKDSINYYITRYLFFFYFFFQVMYLCFSNYLHLDEEFIVGLCIILIFYFLYFFNKNLLFELDLNKEDFFFSLRLYLIFLIIFAYKILIIYLNIIVLSFLYRLFFSSLLFYNNICYLYNLSKINKESIYNYINLYFISKIKEELLIYFNFLKRFAILKHYSVLNFIYVFIKFTETFNGHDDNDIAKISLFYSNYYKNLLIVYAYICLAFIKDKKDYKQRGFFFDNLKLSYDELEAIYNYNQNRK